MPKMDAATATQELAGGQNDLPYDFSRFLKRPQVEDVGKREQHALASRMAALLAHLLKWAYQPERRGASWEKTIKAQRKEVHYVLAESPSLAPKMQEPVWLDMVWSRAVAQAVTATGLDCFPDECPWSIQNEVLLSSWLPAE